MKLIVSTITATMQTTVNDVAAEHVHFMIETYDVNIAKVQFMTLKPYIW